MLSPNFMERGSQENTGAISKKPDLSTTSTRKPFVDRSVNETPFQKTKSFPSKTTHLIQEKPKLKLKSPEKKYPDWLLDTCNYKDVFDHDYDIFPLSSRQVLRDGLNACLKGKATPSPKIPQAFYNRMDSLYDYSDVKINFSDKNFSYCKHELDIEEPEIPQIEV